MSEEKKRKEAIKGLKRLRDDFSGYKPNEEMFDMAIAALSAEPCEDAISRQYLRKQFQEKCVGECSCCEWDSPYWCGLIDNAPPVNPQPKTGHWMPIEYPTGVEAFGVKEMSAQELQCSECGKTVDISDGDFKYCPYCKARMVEPQESEGEHDKACDKFEGYDDV